MADTWGISGPAFLTGYIGTTVALLVIAAIHRRVLFGGRRVRVDELGPQEVAYLRAGSQLALYTSIGALRAAGAIGTSEKGTLAAVGPLPYGATELDNAVYRAAASGTKTALLGMDPAVRAADERIRDRLAAGGFTISAARLRTARLWVWVFVAIIGVGVVRALAGAFNHKPIGGLVGAMVLAGIIAFQMTTSKRGATRATTKAIEKLRKKHGYLEPRQSPAYATYGIGGVALGVALYGTASLHTMDPAFAAQAGIGTNVAAVGGSGYTDSGSSYDSSCSGGSSSSCGGGSCGGSCGG